MLMPLADFVCIQLLEISLQLLLLVGNGI